MIYNIIIYNIIILVHINHSNTTPSEYLFPSIVSQSLHPLLSPHQPPPSKFSVLWPLFLIPCKLSSVDKILFWWRRPFLAFLSCFMFYWITHSLKEIESNWGVKTADKELSSTKKRKTRCWRFMVKERGKNKVEKIYGSRYPNH